MSMYENVGLTSLDYIEEILQLRKALADVSDECSKAYDKIANLEQQRWISIKDRMPEIGKSVLIYYPKWDGDEIQVAKLEDDGMVFDICGEFNIGTGVVTHWMPLPKPPESEDDEEWKK